MNKNESIESLDSLNSQLTEKELSKVCLLTTDPDTSLASAICQRLGAPLSVSKVDFFANGEARPVIKPSIHGKKVFLLSTISPACRADLTSSQEVSKVSKSSESLQEVSRKVENSDKSINDYLMGTMLTIGALRRAGAKEVTLIIPSYPYARQDKKDEPHAAISASHIAKLLTVSGITRLICLDLHAAAIQGFFPEEVPVDNLYAISPIIEHIRDNVFTNPRYLVLPASDESADKAVLETPKGNLNASKGNSDASKRNLDAYKGEKSDPSKERSEKSEKKFRDPMDCFIAVSPDEGAFKRTRKYAESLFMPYLCLTKTRDYSKKNHVDDSKTLIFGNTNELHSRWAIIFDDMCDTFGTIQAAAKKLVEAGALGVIVVVTHGILSGPAIERLNKTKEVVELICSDSLPQLKNQEYSSKISTFSIAPLLAEVIRRRLCKESVSEIFYHT